jgi:uncharacterized damage-inducible protein DinB
MTEDLFKLLDTGRSRTLNTLENTREDTADIMPAGFRNTIRWNLGHIAAVQEVLAFYFTGETILLPEEFRAFFARGTRPSDWETQPPSLHTISDYLKEQPARIRQTFKNRLEEQVPNPFKLGSSLELTTVGSILTFTLYHEGMHQGVMYGLQRAIDGRDQEG